MQGDACGRDLILRVPLSAIEPQVAGICPGIPNVQVVTGHDVHVKPDEVERIRLDTHLPLSHRHRAQLLCAPGLNLQTKSRPEINTAAAVAERLVHTVAARLDGRWLGALALVSKHASLPTFSWFWPRQDTVNDAVRQ